MNRFLGRLIRTFSYSNSPTNTYRECTKSKNYRMQKEAERGYTNEGKEGLEKEAKMAMLISTYTNKGNVLTSSSFLAQLKLLTKRANEYLFRYWQHLPNHSSKGKELVKEKIKKGDVLKLQELLFTKDRDFLIKCVGNQQVKAEHLVGKVVVICFASLYRDLYIMEYDISTLVDVYCDLQPNNSFEVIFVATDKFDASTQGEMLRDSDKVFDEKPFCVPWTAVPLSDTASRKRLQEMFDVSGNWSTMFIIDSGGMVLRGGRDAWLIFNEYGGLGFPFTDERSKFLNDEDEATSKQPSLKTLLASPQRDYLISNNGRQVPIETLEDKVVALYFYEDSIRDEEDHVTTELKIAYEKFKREFEVVLIYLNDAIETFDFANEETFSKRFKTMPWLALPFKDPNIKKLKRIFGYPCDRKLELSPKLVIFGPHGEFIEPFGFQILCTYGLPSYPFTRMNVAKLEAEKVKEVKLEMLWDPNTVFRREDGSEVLFSQLAGKGVVLFFESLLDYHFRDGSPNNKFLNTLRNRYLDMKGTNDEFEVIYILESKYHIYVEHTELDYVSWATSKTESCASEYIGDMPWLVSFEDKFVSGKFGHYLSCGYLHEYYSQRSSIVVFDRDGKLVRRTLFPTFGYEDFPISGCDLEEECLYQFGYEDFPISGCDLEEECLYQLTYFLKWNYWDYYQKGGPIYWHKDKFAKRMATWFKAHSILLI